MLKGKYNTSQNGGNVILSKINHTEVIHTNSNRECNDGNPC